MLADDDALGELLDELGVELELNAAAPDMEPLLDALVDHAPPARLERAAADAAEAIWSNELELELATEFHELRQQTLEEDAELAVTIDATLAELKRAPAQNRVALALVWRAAVKLLRRANRNHERMAELEQALAGAPRAEHRRLTLPVAQAATLAADVGDEEAAKAIARFAVDLAQAPQAGRKRFKRARARLARALATDERRRDTRAALAELVALSAEEFPHAAAALEHLVAEPIPKDPASDDLWVSVVVGLAEEQLAEIVDEPPG